MLPANLLAGDRHNARLETRHRAPHWIQSDARIATFSAASHTGRANSGTDRPEITEDVIGSSVRGSKRTLLPHT